MVYNFHWFRVQKPLVPVPLSPIHHVTSTLGVSISVPGPAFVLLSLLFLFFFPEGRSISFCIKSQPL